MLIDLAKKIADKTKELDALETQKRELSDFIGRYCTPPQKISREIDTLSQELFVCVCVCVCVCVHLVARRQLQSAI